MHQRIFFSIFLYSIFSRTLTNSRSNKALCYYKHYSVLIYRTLDLILSLLSVHIIKYENLNYYTVSLTTFSCSLKIFDTLIFYIYFVLETSFNSRFPLCSRHDVSRQKEIDCQNTHSNVYMYIPFYKKRRKNFNAS